jgi:hypothetical protein
MAHIDLPPELPGLRLSTEATAWPSIQYNCLFTARAVHAWKCAPHFIKRSRAYLLRHKSSLIWHFEFD